MSKFRKQLGESFEKDAARRVIYSFAKPSDSVFTVAHTQTELAVLLDRGINPARVCFVNYSSQVLAHLNGKFLPKNLKGFSQSRHEAGSASEVAKTLSKTVTVAKGKKCVRYTFANLDLMGFARLTKSHSGLREVVDFLSTDLLGPSIKHHSGSQTYTLAVTLLCGRDARTRNDRVRQSRLETAIKLGLSRRAARTGVTWFFQHLASFPYATKSPMRVWLYALGTNKTLVENRER